MSTLMGWCVNPKLKCHPNAQSRNVTFLLAQDTEFTTTLPGQHRVLRKVEQSPGMRHRYRSTFLLRPGGRARGRRLKQLRFNYLSLLLFLFAVNGVRQWPLLIFDRDLTAAFLTYLNVRAAHSVGRTLGFDLIDHIVVGKRQVLRQRPPFTKRQHALEIFTFT